MHELMTGTTTTESLSDQELLDRYFLEKDGMYYIELSELAKLPYVHLPSECFSQFKAVEKWVTGYLTQPHPNLGRDGAVCPFVKNTVIRNGFYLTAIYTEDLDINTLPEILDRWQNIFLGLEPCEGKSSIFRTLLILFPELSDEEADVLFKKMLESRKSSFVEKGLMLGEFHAGPPEKYGLHNPSFKPLYSPMPLLAIREMVRSDIAFLKDHPQYMKSYERKFPLQ